MHHKVRITVVKRSLNKDLIARFVPTLAEVAAPCPFFRDGQVFVIDGYPPAQPEGFCGWAWFDIHRAVALAADGGDMVFGNSFPTCGDGLRPVVFHIEQLNEEAPDRLAPASSRAG